jgi:hypothetical protein
MGERRLAREIFLVLWFEVFERKRKRKRKSMNSGRSVDQRMSPPPSHPSGRLDIKEPDE